MDTITIPKEMIKKEDELMFVPRKKYEELLRLQSTKPPQAIKEFTPTAAEKKDLARARRNRTRGYYLTINELKRKLGFTG